MVSLASQVAYHPEILAGLSDKELLELEFDWKFWARPNQIEPDDFRIGLAHIWLILAGRGYGKALALNTPIPTVEGWTAMGDIQVGDRLLDEQGHPCTVTHVTGVQLGNTCYKITFDDKSTIIADAEHLWFTWDKSARRAFSRPGVQATPGLRTTKQIATSLYIGKEANHAILLTGPLQLPEANLLVDPYVLGMWLGDGSSASATLTVSVDDSEETIANLVAHGCRINENPRRIGNTYMLAMGNEEPSRGSDGRMQANGSLHSRLKELTVLNNKHIPLVYLRASEAQRRDLLAGLLDTDGSASPKGYVEYCTTLKILGLQVYDLVSSLGYKATLTTGRAMLNGVDCGPKYRVKFTPNEAVFKLTRKNERILTNLGSSQQTRTLFRYIHKVELVPTVPVKCIIVDSPHHMFLAGYGMIPTHNSRCGAETTNDRVENKRAGFIGLVAPSAADARDIMIEGPSGIVTRSKPWFKAVYHPSKRSVTWPNGAKATVYSAEDPDQLRGPQHDWIWFDELAAYPHLTIQSVWDNAMFGLRMGAAQCMITTTPRPIKILRELVKKAKEERTVHITKGSTYENLSNLSATFRDQVVTSYEGTRLGRQELHAEILDDVPNALWTWLMLDGTRIMPINQPAMHRIVVAVDPAGSRNGHEIGIIVAGIAYDGQGYVLDDLSLQGSPDIWGNTVIAAYDKYEADCIVIENNFGGEMVSNVIHNIRSTAPVREVRASRGKAIRAEPVSMLYERGLVHHVGSFPTLEDQLTTWLSEEGPNDRVDALVWAFTDLMPGQVKGRVWFIGAE